MVGRQFGFPMICNELATTFHTYHISPRLQVTSNMFHVPFKYARIFHPYVNQSEVIVTSRVQFLFFLADYSDPIFLALDRVHT